MSGAAALFVLCASALICGTRPAVAAGFVQQAPEILGSNLENRRDLGASVALSADGNTAIVGGPGANGGAGAAWVFIRSSDVTWTQQGNPLIGTGAVGNAYQGTSVAVSADGNTAIVGGNADNGGIGAAWVFTRNNGVWTQQGSKLVGTGAVGSTPYQGISVALSADGNTAIVGGWFDDGEKGAAWIFTRSGSLWAQQGNKLHGTGAIEGSTYGTRQGFAVALSGDGNTAIVGGYGDNGGVGAAWIFTRSGSLWAQQGNKLHGTGAIDGNYGAQQGFSVALSGDGDTAIVGGFGDNNSSGGAVWVFTRSGGVWTQQGPKLVGTGAAGGAGQGRSVALSADGNTAIVGGPYDNENVGAAWVFTRSSGTWSQQDTKLVGGLATRNASQGASIALSADGSTALVGGPGHNLVGHPGVGAVWFFFWRPISHDFSGDRRADILWRHTGGGVGMWLMNGISIVTQADLGFVDPAWQIAGTSSLVQSTLDLNGDGKADLLWRHSGGDVAIWLMDGSTPKLESDLGPLDNAWQIAGLGDIDGDGKADILWRHTNGGLGVWLMNGSAVKAAVGLGTVDTAWQIAGIGDFDGDGKADILWRKNNGEVAIWPMYGTAINHAVDLGVVDSAWQIVGVGDFDGDGKADILWHKSDGELGLWLMNGTTPIVEVGLGTVDTAWQVVSTGDYDGDGNTDILWRKNDGGLGVWLMKGTTLKAAIGLGNVDTSWTVVE